LTCDQHRDGRKTVRSAHYDALAATDPVLARLIGVHGHPDPFAWNDGGRTGPDNFAAMVLHIVSQQISTAAAFTIFSRIAAAAGGLPDQDGLLRLGADGLRACGLSRAKASYLVDLAGRQASGLIDLRHMDDTPDDKAIAELTAVPGIGLWSAQMFLVFQLRRPDVLPAGDLGIRHAIEAAWKLHRVPAVSEVRDRGTAWAPHRTYATALLWRSLNVPGLPPQA
jgi:DNA-3-methyladenine glycosylase II